LAGRVAVTANEEAFYRVLGERIAELRREQGMTQQQLANALGISQKTVGHYEVGRIRVQVCMLPELADYLGVSISELIDPVRKALGKRKPSRRPSESGG
jgi:transcriptional regulator with XRE-family HTH domain